MKLDLLCTKALYKVSYGIPVSQRTLCNAVWLGFCLYFVSGRRFVTCTYCVRNLIIYMYGTLRSPGNFLMLFAHYHFNTCWFSFGAHNEKAAKVEKSPTLNVIFTQKKKNRKRKEITPQTNLLMLGFPKKMLENCWFWPSVLP